MKVMQNINIHNRFDVKIENINTKEIKTGIYGENIILDQMYERLCNRLPYFTHIHYGAGTGEPDKTNTSLNTYLGNKSAIDESLFKKLPISIWKRKIVLQAGDEVGNTISEVGIGYGTGPSNLVTHALLKDSEGNPISIVKTSENVVTIYATVYVSFDESIDGFNWLGFPNNNGVANYLVGGGFFPDCKFALIPSPSPFQNLGLSSYVDWVADVSNKKIKTGTKRFDVNDANGDCLGFDLTDVFQVSFPSTDIHTGRTYENVAVGIGTGNNESFLLPSRNIINGSLTIRENGVATTNFTKENEKIISDVKFIGGMPSMGNSVAVSRDGKVVAVGNHTTSPYVKIYDWDGSVMTERATPPNATTGNSVALSSDGSVLVIGTEGYSPYIKIYDYVMDEWVERATPPSVPSLGYAVSISDDGKTIAIGSESVAPYVSVYDWVIDEWVIRVAPPTLPTNGWAVSLNQDATVLAVGHYSKSPYVTVYDWVIDEWVVRLTPPNMPSFGWAVSLSDDGNVLAVATNDKSPYVKIYDWDGSSWTGRLTPPNMPSRGYSVSLNSDGNILAVAHSSTSPYAKLYEWVYSEWIERASLPNMAIQGQMVSLSGDGEVLGVATYNRYPYAKLYDNRIIEQTKVIMDTVLNDEITADYKVKGVSKTTNQVIDVSCSIQFGEGTAT